MCSAAAPGARKRGAALETVIGYSDSAEFSVHVGPTPVSDASEGLFANVVKPVVRDARGDAQPPAGGSSAAERTGVSPAQGLGRDTKARSSAAQQAEFKQFLESRTKRSVYDELPPPERG